MSRLGWSWSWSFGRTRDFLFGIRAFDCAFSTSPSSLDAVSRFPPVSARAARPVSPGVDGTGRTTIRSGRVDDSHFLFLLISSLRFRACGVLGLASSPRVRCAIQYYMDTYSLTSFSVLLILVPVLPSSLCSALPCTPTLLTPTPLPCFHPLVLFSFFPVSFS
ncbi:hypothetical protein B0H13DRAFT_255902 [Mycena leptocephala]|nr:hypothetical protein B0H13DRAFT_255902 [Mycena leptocephala]